MEDSCNVLQDSRLARGHHHLLKRLDCVGISSFFRVGAPTHPLADFLHFRVGAPTHPLPRRRADALQDGLCLSNSHAVATLRVPDVIPGLLPGPEVWATAVRDEAATPAPAQPRRGLLTEIRIHLEALVSHVGCATSPPQGVDRSRESFLNPSR